jgi:uncharacterized membrane protein
MSRSNRLWWLVAALLAGAILVLLVVVTGRQRIVPASGLAAGESETIRASVLAVLEEGTAGQGDLVQPYQRLRLRLSGGTMAGQEIEVEHGLLGFTNRSRMFREGDRVLVEHTVSIEGEDHFLVTDYVRTGPLLGLTLFFAVATLLLSGWQGVRSLLGMAISLVIIVGFIVPQILAGWNPVLVAIAGSVVMMGISLYLVYGWNRKTHVAVAGLFVTLILTGLLAFWSVHWTRLSGFGAEESSFLQAAGYQIDTQGLLLAGIIIGTLGALDDIAVGQSSTIFELHKANPALGWRTLFAHGMTVGRDHIAAMVNTLFLAYVGAALPLLLLFFVFTDPLGITLNREIVAEEIVRTLVGSLGLLAGVPLTTALATFVARRQS